MAERKIHALAITEYTDSRGDKKTRWRRIGVAFENDREDRPGGVGKRGGSITVHLDAVPLSWFGAEEARIQLRLEDDPGDRGGDRGRR